MTGPAFDPDPAMAEVSRLRKQLERAERDLKEWKTTAVDLEQRYFDAEARAQERLEEVMRVSGEAAGLEARAQKAEAVVRELSAYFDFDQLHPDVQERISALTTKEAT